MLTIKNKVQQRDQNNRQPSKKYKCFTHTNPETTVKNKKSDKDRGRNQKKVKN